MENEKGVLLSGAGRIESQAELSENEKRFLEIINFLVEGVEGTIKKYNFNEAELRNVLSRGLINTLRVHLKENKHITIYEALKNYFNDKENGLLQFKQILLELESFVERKKEEWEDITIQSVFSKLGQKPENIADMMSDAGVKEGDEYLN